MESELKLLRSKDINERIRGMTRVFVSNLVSPNDVMKRMLRRESDDQMDGLCELIKVLAAKGECTYTFLTSFCDHIMTTTYPNSRWRDFYLFKVFIAAGFGISPCASWFRQIDNTLVEIMLSCRKDNDRMLSSILDSTFGHMSTMWHHMHTLEHRIHLLIAHTSRSRRIHTCYLFNAHRMQQSDVNEHTKNLMTQRELLSLRRLSYFYCRRNTILDSIQEIRSQINTYRIQILYIENRSPI